jgi:Family of unknown function (DUF6245)
MPFYSAAKDTPSSVTQLAAALTTLGLYRGANTLAEHADEARRLGGDEAYRVRLANALLGASQTEALLADAIPISLEARVAAYEQQFVTAGVADDPAKKIAFLRWQTLRVSGPLPRDRAETSAPARSHSPPPMPLTACNNCSASSARARTRPWTTPSGWPARSRPSCRLPAKHWLTRSAMSTFC